MLFTTSLIALIPLLSLTLASPIKRATGMVIRDNADGLCITPDAISAFYVSDGTPVVTKPCEHALRWNISPGTGSVVLTGNDKFALDAGAESSNNGSLIVSTSIPGSYGQTWTFTLHTHQLSLRNQVQCLESTDTGVQTYECTADKADQLFYPIDGSDFTSTSTTTSPSAGPTQSSEPDPCYGSGGDLITTTINGTPTTTVIISTPTCMGSK